MALVVRVFLILLALILLTLFQGYLALPFYFVGVGYGYLKYGLDIISTNFFSIPQPVYVLYYIIPRIFVFKIIRKKVMHAEN